MMNRKNKKIGASSKRVSMATAVILLLACPTALLAQQYLSQQGHLLDANTRLGSFGWNTSARLGPLVPRANSYITGNVTGGASFKGLVPYRSESDFGGLLGSSTLSNFNRDSYGSSNLSSGMNFVRTYQDPSRSVATIQNGRVVNTNRVQNLAATRLSQRFADRSDTAREFNTSHTFRTSNSALNMSFSNYAKKTSPGQSSFVSNPFDPATPSQSNATTPLKKYQSDQLTTTRQQTQVTENKLDTRMDTTLSPTRQGKPLLATPSEPTAEQNERPYAFKPVQQPPDDQTSQSVPFGMKKTTRQRDYDLTDEMYQEMTGTMDELDTIMSQPPIHQDLSSIRSQTAGGPVAKKPNMNIVLQEKLNSQMAVGNAMMTQGRYYHAAAAFDRAAVLDINNPNVALARSQALLCAGEFMSAAWYLNQALVLSPKIAGSQSTTFHNVLSSEKFQPTYQELNEFQQATENPMLGFLMSYTLYQRSQNTEARAMLTATLQQQPDNQAVKALLDIVTDTLSKTQTTK